VMAAEKSGGMLGRRDGLPVGLGASRGGSAASARIAPPRLSGPRSEHEEALQSRLESLVCSSSVLMGALRAARAVGAPDWLIGGSVIRDRVWDHLHGIPSRPVKDMELLFFDPCSLGRDRERSLQSAVSEQAPDICWEVTNQAGAHLWYPQVYGIDLAPLRSSADGVGTWAESATAVAIRLLEDQGMLVVAPYGLGDLFGLVCRRNPRVASRGQFRRRVARMQIAKRWPRARVIDT
jgi:hypothetical protein